MPLNISQKSEKEVPTPGRTGKVNEDLIAVKDAMKKLGSDMVLEIEATGQTSVRAAKGMVTRASKELGTRWQHWSVGSKVFAKPLGEVRKRAGRPKKTA